MSPSELKRYEDRPVISWARLLPPNVEPFRNLRSSGHTRAQKAGKKYEARVLLHLSGHFHDVQAARWFQYDTQSGHARFCQPDAFTLDRGTLTIFEIKLTHVPGARMQMENLYAPVLRHVFDPKHVRFVEIVRSVNDRPQDCVFHMDFAEFADYTFVPNTYEVLRWRL